MQIFCMWDEGRAVGRRATRGFYFSTRWALTDNALRNQYSGQMVESPQASVESTMKSIILWLLGVPIVVIILLNVTGMLGH